MDRDLCSYSGLFVVRLGSVLNVESRSLSVRDLGQVTQKTPNPSMPIPTVRTTQQYAFFQHAHFIPLVIVGKERRILIDWSVVTCKMEAPVSGTTLRTTGPVSADSRQ